MKENSTTIFIEVRYQRNIKFGSGAESVDKHKQKKLLATAAYYLQKNPKALREACRFDVFSLTMKNGEQQLDWITDTLQA